MLKLANAGADGATCAAAGELAQPTLIVRGTRSPDANRAMCRALERCARKAQTLDVADAGPDPQIDQPQEFVAGIADFLR